MKRILGIVLATALLGGCVVVPAGHGYRGDGGWRDDHFDRNDRNDRYDRHDSGWSRDGRGWRRPATTGAADARRGAGSTRREPPYATHPRGPHDHGPPRPPTAANTCPVGVA